MILTTNGPANSRMKIKKSLYLDNVDDENSISSSISCEFGPDGIRFVRDNIKVTKEGMCKITDDQVTPLSLVSSEDLEFGAEIGRGASGVVQEGIYKVQNLPIAVKTISIYDKDKRRQVVNDLQNFLHDRLEQVKGNNIELSNYIVQVYGAYYDEGSIKIILELMDAGSLRDMLNMSKRLKSSGPYIEEPYLANIAYQILAGLHFIHTKKKQIHRDIKPENVLINSLGHVKLSDFGISKQLEKTQAFSKTFVGTVTYMSPERLVGEPYGFSSDLWSLGIILIELATGEYPYKKTKKFIEMLQNIRNLPEPNVPDNGLYSPQLRDFIDKCLKKDPSKRCSAGELMGHPWLVQNSELNFDLSDLVCNLLFNCKYEPAQGQQESIAEMETVCDRVFYDDQAMEEQKIETPSFLGQGLGEQPKLTRFFSFGDVSDSNSNLMTNCTQDSSLNLAEVNLNRFQSFGLADLRVKPKEFSFIDCPDTTSSKKSALMDLEIENME